MSQGVKSEFVEENLAILNGTEMPYPSNKTLIQIFEDQVTKTPHKIALVEGERSLTYAQFNNQVNQLAWFLREKGVKAETLVALCMPRSIDFIISVYAILKAGGCYVPMEANHPPERINYVLENSKAAILLVANKLIDKIKNFPGDSYIFEEITSQALSQSLHNLPVSVTPHNLAYVIYTSGSTGKPKGVQIEQHSVVNLTYALQDKFPLKETGTYLFKTNVAFDMSVHEIYTALLHGGRLAILPQGDERDYSRFVIAMEQHAVTHLVMVPSVFQAMIDVLNDSDIAKMQTLHYLFLGGEAVPDRLITKARTRLNDALTLVNIYGPTEGTVWQTYCNRKLEAGVPSNTIGRPLPNLTAYLLDEHLQPVTVGFSGELYIGGCSIARGYLNQPELTQEKFIPNPFNEDSKDRLYKTGDICRYLADGNLQYVERADFQVKIHGFRIEPGEIEARLMTHSAIKEAVVIAQMQQPQGEKFLVAYYILHPQKTAPDDAVLKHYLADNLPEYMIPDFFMPMTAFPVNDNGKLDRKAFPLPEFSRKENNYVAPRDALEKLIIKVWQEELNLQQVGIEDDFFNVGGNSLLATRTTYTLNQTLDKQITLRDFYTLRTVKGLVNLLKGAQIVQPSQLSKKNNKDYFLLDNGAAVFWLMEHKTRLTAEVAKVLLGKVDSEALKHAFKCVLQKNPILTCRLDIKKPVLKINHAIDDFSYLPKEYDLRHLSVVEQEEIVSKGVAALSRMDFLDKRRPLLRAELYRLTDEKSKLFLIATHVACDGTAMDIIMQQVHEYYTRTLQGEIIEKVEPDFSYQELVEEEQEYINKNIERDIEVWQDYFKDAEFFNFKNVDLTKIDPSLYSQQRKITLATLQSAQKFCVENKIVLTHYLVAVVAYALKPYAKKGVKQVVELIKSVRNKPQYKHTVASLLRADLIKVDVNTDNLIDLSRQVEASFITLLSHQQTPGLVKLACLIKKQWENRRFIRYYAKFMSHLIRWIHPDWQANKIFLEYATLYVTAPSNIIVLINITENFLNAQGCGEDFVNYNPFNTFVPEINFNTVNITFDNFATGPGLLVHGDIPLEDCRAVSESILSMLGSSSSLKKT